MKPIHFATLALVGVLSGCGSRDPRFENLAVGLSKDSVMTLMGVEKAQRIDPFLVGGKYIEVMYYAPPGSNDSVPDREASPLIAVDGVLQAWGWKSLDSLAQATRIPVAPK